MSGLGFVSEDADRFELTVHEFADVVAPDEGLHHKQQEFSNPLQVSEMIKILMFFYEGAQRVGTSNV